MADIKMTVGDGASFVNKIDPAVFENLPAHMRRELKETVKRDSERAKAVEKTVGEVPEIIEGQETEVKTDADVDADVGNVDDGVDTSIEEPVLKDDVSDKTIHDSNAKSDETVVGGEEQGVSEPEAKVEEPADKLTESYEKLFRSHQTLTGKYNAETARLREENKRLKAELEAIKTKPVVDANVEAVRNSDVTEDKLVIPQELRDEAVRRGWDDDDIDFMARLAQSGSRPPAKANTTEPKDEPIHETYNANTQQADYVLDMGLAQYGLSLNDVLAQPALFDSWGSSATWGETPILDALNTARAEGRIKDAQHIVQVLASEMQKDNVWIPIPGQVPAGNHAPDAPQKAVSTPKGIMPRGVSAPIAPTPQARRMDEISRDLSDAITAYRKSASDDKLKRIRKLQQEQATAIRQQKRT